MNKQRIHRLSASALLLAGLVMSTTVAAASLNDIFEVAGQLNAQALRSQSKIDALTDETRELLADYKIVLKEIEGLRVYNRQLEKQIASQEREMATLTRSINDVTVIERQITPLMLRMIEGLRQFVDLDLPFLLDERSSRIDQLVSMMDRADVAVSEKFNVVLRAYQIENEYGRTMEAYDDTISVDGIDRKVDILKMGRISLVYQTEDGQETGMYNPVSRRWERLDDDYKAAVQNGLRMARQQLSVDMLALPVTGPEAAR